MEELKLTVTGMTCSGCENAVRRAVSNVAGVANVTASHQRNQVVVDYDPRTTDRTAISKAIQAAGYVVA
jgi:copper chaperone CopZ